MTEKVLRPRMRFYFIVSLAIVLGAYFAYTFVAPAVTSGSVTETVLTAENEALRIGENDWTIFQKYKVEENQYCVLDCNEYARMTNSEFSEAYVRTWGQCICKTTRT